MVLSLFVGLLALATSANAAYTQDSSSIPFAEYGTKTYTVAMPSKTASSAATATAAGTYDGVVSYDPSRYVCDTSTAPAPVDYLFLVDGSGSMGPYIAQITKGLAAFVSKVEASGIDARYSVVVFGGDPTLLIPFTSATNDVQDTLNGIDATYPGNEASFEAIRIALSGDSMDADAGYQRGCSGKYNTTAACSVVWRPGATRSIIVATDEDSDLPARAANRNTGQTPNINSSMCASSSYSWPCSSSGLFEPRFYSKTMHLYKQCSKIFGLTICGYQEFRDGVSPIWLSPAYMQEVVDTATAIVHQNAFVSFLMRSDMNANDNGPISSYDGNNPIYSKGTKATNHTAIIQFGDPDLASQSATFGNFNATQTYKNLVNAGLERSLQALVLKAGGYMRLFRIQDFISSSGDTVVTAFYNQQVVVSSQCKMIAAP
ncbi:hypothetical protein CAUPRSCDRAFT_11180, partial [Caulochytrium protostelioides]